jgi:tRNA G18 (ribose-2'-O)-methylase SpoU
MRDKTRRERYDDKQRTAKTYPISLVCVNFQHDGNLGYLIRSAACFGAHTIHVIGSVPDRSILNPHSGSLYDYVKIIQHSKPSDFLHYCKTHEIKLVSAEICEGAQSITTYTFDFASHLALVVGNEESGIPIEILENSDKVYIPMPGVGYCLNTAQAANIMLYETIKRYDAREEFYEMWLNESGIHLP